MYEAAAGKLESLMNLKEYIGPAATTMAATAAGMATVIGSQKLYKVWSKAKHDPIRQVIEVDGYSTVSIPKWYRNFFIGRKMKIFGKDIRPRKYENTRGNMRVVGEIRVKDYKNMGTKKDKAYVCLHIDKEPHKVRGDMSPVGIFATFNHLKTYIADSLDQLKAEDGSCAYMDDENKPHIGIDNLSDLMEKSQAYETLSEDKHQKLSPGDVSIIHKALLSRQDLIPESGNVLDVDVNKLTEYINTAVGTDGGRFSRVLYREGSDSTGQWVPYIYIEENEGATKSISQDANGTDWAKRGKCNMYLTWSSKMHANVGEDAGGADEAGADEVGEDIGAADESGSEAGPSDDPDMGGAGGDDYETLKRNHIRKLDKPLGRAIANWGDVYKVIFKGESYDMIRCPFDSGPLPKGKAIRDSYIVMHGDSLVARIEESAVVTKWWPIQNHDWEGHVFDKSLAKSTDFGMLVGGLTHYLQNRNLYDKNACRKQIDLASTSIPQDEIA